MNPIRYDHCPLCQSGDLSFFLNTSDFMLSKEAYGLWKCASCGFVFTQNAPGPEEIGKYYQSHDYISHSDTKQGLMNRLYHMARSFMLGEKYRMVRRVAKGKALLDIGTGTGYFPNYMKQKGYRAMGVEVDPKAREFAEKEFGLKVFSPGDFISKKIQGKFDAITLWHVLEHVHDLHPYMERMKDYLEPDGALIIALPNCTSLDARHYRDYWAGYDVPRHLWHFTPSTLKKLASDHGFEVRKMKRLPLDPFYNAMLSEKYKGNKLYLLSGMIIGKLAFLESLFRPERSSSLVYFLTSKL